MADLITSAEMLAAWPAFTTVVADAGEQAALITAASAAVEAYCGRVFATGTVTDTLSVRPASTRVVLSRWPVTAITSVTLDDVALDSTTDYVLDGDARTLYRGEAGNGRDRLEWPAGIKNLVVVYTAGYTTIPDLVKRATILAVRHLAETVAAAGAGLTGETLGAYSYTRDLTTGNTDLPMPARLLLKDYRDTWAVL